MQRFENRRDAGRALAKMLSAYADRNDVVVYGLPRGGVPVAFEVARALDAPLDVFLVRKLGVPGHSELAMGAIASGGVRVTNTEIITALRIPEDVIEEVAQREGEQLLDRARAYQGDRPGIDPAGKIAILVDDGLATGATMRAAVAALRLRHPVRIIVAVPTAPPDTCQAMFEVADDAVCLLMPQSFDGVGGSYVDFVQTSDAEVRKLLTESTEQR